MTPSPYAPPRTPSPDAGTLEVIRGAELPLVCLKCGRTHEVTPHPKTLVVVGRARIAVLAVALLSGILVAVVRSPETRMQLFMGLAVLAFLVRRFLYPGLEMPIALCGPCADRWAKGTRWSKIFRGAIFLCSAISTIVLLIDTSSLLVIPFALGIFAAMAGLLLLRMRTRIVVAKEVKGDVVTLALLHPDAVDAIRRRQ